MNLRHQHWAVASLLIGQYGTAARTRAAAFARAADRNGDLELREIWHGVVEALEQPLGRAVQSA